MGDWADEPQWDEFGLDDDVCPTCGDGANVPAVDYWICPTCDAEWHPLNPTGAAG